MPTATVPINFEAEAQERLDRIGHRRELERMLEHIARTIPKLRKIEVTAPYNEVLGPDQQIVVEAHIQGIPAIELYLELDDWLIENIPSEASSQIVVLIVGG